MKPPYKTRGSSGGVMECWNDRAGECLPNNPTFQQSITPFLVAHPAYTVALGSLLGIEGPQDTTDLTTSKPTLAGVDPARRDGVVELDFDKSISDGVPPCANPELSG